jgi:DNA-binding NtrC family response regulator
MRKREHLNPLPEGALGQAVPIVVGMTIRQADKLLIEATLQQVEGSIRAAATILGIDRSTLYARIELYRDPKVG